MHCIELTSTHTHDPHNEMHVATKTLAIHIHMDSYVLDPIYKYRQCQPTVRRGNRNNNKSGHCVSVWRQYRQTFGGGGWRRRRWPRRSVSDMPWSGMAPPQQQQPPYCASTLPTLLLLLLVSRVFFFFCSSALNIYKAPHIYINWIFWMRYEASEKRKIIIIICTCVLLMLLL